MNALLDATERAIASLLSEGDSFASRELLRDLQDLRAKLLTVDPKPGSGTA